MGSFPTADTVFEGFVLRVSEGFEFRGFRGFRRLGFSLASGFKPFVACRTCKARRVDVYCLSLQVLQGL